MRKPEALVPKLWQRKNHSKAVSEGRGGVLIWEASHRLRRATRRSRRKRPQV